MFNRTVRLSRATTTIAIALAAAVSAAAGPAVAAPQFDAFIKFPPGAADRSAQQSAQQGEVEVQSWSWGATQMGSAGSGGGMGAGKVNMQDISVMRGPRQTTALDGSVVAAPDTAESPRDAASGQASGKRTHNPMKIEKPLEKGSIVLKMALADCAVGTQYPSAEIFTPDTAYALTGVEVASCGDEVTLNYAKVKVRGWNPETKED